MFEKFEKVNINVTAGYLETLYTCPYFTRNKYRHMVGAHSNACFSMGPGSLVNRLGQTTEGNVYLKRSLDDPFS